MKAVVFDRRTDGQNSDDAGLNVDGIPQDCGIQDLLTPPTLAGIRAGNDEVLVAALAVALHDTGG
ncbi:MAG: hypothetical protein ABI304_11055 [Rudaea sp.]